MVGHVKGVQPRLAAVLLYQAMLAPIGLAVIETLIGRAGHYHRLFFSRLLVPFVEPLEVRHSIAALIGHTDPCITAITLGKSERAGITKYEQRITGYLVAYALPVNGVLGVDVEKHHHRAIAPPHVCGAALEMLVGISQM